MVRKVSNNAQTTLSGGLAAGATTMTVNTGDGGLFQDVFGGFPDYDFELLTIEETGVGVEVVKVTAHETAGANPDQFTIERSQENTPDLTFTGAATVSAYMTAGALSDSVFTEPLDTKASLFVDSAAANSDVTYTANEPGKRGNTITVTHTDPAAPSSPLSITVTGGLNIDVSLETDGGSGLITTANDLIAAIALDQKAGHLVTVTNFGGSTGAGVVDALTQTSLSGATGKGVMAIAINPLPFTTYHVFGDASIGIGRGARTNKTSDICIGVFARNDSTGTGDSGLAIGYQAQISGSNTTAAMAFGKQAVASASNAISIGTQTSVGGADGIGIGRLITSVGIDCINIGRSSTTAGATDAISFGRSSTGRGDNSVAIGRNSFASSVPATGAQVVVGFGARSDGDQGVAVGTDSIGRDQSVAVGYDAEADGTKRIALGAYALSDVDGMAHIRGPIFVRQADGHRSDIIQEFAGAEVILMSGEYDLTSATPFAGNSYKDILVIPAGVLFYPTEVGIVTTTQNTVTVNPIVSFGLGTTGTQLLNNQTFANLGQSGGSGFYNALQRLGNGTFSVDVNTAATATTLDVRFYWKGAMIGQ